jgi:hypothetical protein
MRIAGEWLTCADGVTGPAIRLYATAETGERERDDFLVDSGADRTVLSAHFIGRLRVAGNPPPADFDLSGIGGGVDFVVVRTALELMRDDGLSVTIRGEFAAFTDPRAAEISILGRDVLDTFRLVVSRVDGEVLMLAGNHRYQVFQA